MAVEGWSAIEWEYVTGGRRWAIVHDACSSAYIERGQASGSKDLSDIDGVAEEYAAAYPLLCEYCWGK